MGIKRFLWRSTAIGAGIDTIRNIVDEGNVIKGVKRTYKEHIYEDNPITSSIYKSGMTEGKKEGFTEASDEYRNKLLEQAREFLKQQKLMKNQIEGFQMLIDEYEEMISILSEKEQRTQEENEYLQQLLLMERKLKALKIQ